MKRFLLFSGLFILSTAAVTQNHLWGRGFGGGGFGGGGGGVRGGGGGGFSGGGGGGFSGGGFRPSAPAQRPSMPGGGEGFNRSGGSEFGGGGRELGGAGGNFSRPNVVHNPGAEGGQNLGFGNRPQINSGGGISRQDFASRHQPGADGGGLRQNGGNGPGGFRPDGTGSAGPNNRLPGTSNTTLPGLGGGGGSPLGQGGAGTRNPNISNNNRPGANGGGQQGNRGSAQDRSNDLSGRFNDLQNHYSDGDWHQQQWTGPNGGEINHVGFWGPNGYWGHTGAQGPNGGYWGHTTGIGPNGAYGHTTGIGPNGAVWGHGGAIGPNGAFGYAGHYGPAGQWSRNWGGWYNGYGPAWGNGRWNYLWDTYPAAMAFGATMWGINVVNSAFGVSDYSNPYCDGPVYVDSQPITSYTEPITGDPNYQTADASAAAAVEPAPADAPVGADPLTQLFDQARYAFFEEKFGDAMKFTDQALVKAPRDAAINEFRSLCLFAEERYRESAAAIHAVLAAGPGWDWTTMISLYGNPQTYEIQLRHLEQATKDNPQAADAHFLLAYHYLTCDHKDAAVVQWKKVLELQPSDQLTADLVKMYTPPSYDDSVKTAEKPSPNVDKPAYPMEKLRGNWKAKSQTGDFALALNDDESFSWKFIHNGKPQEVKGAYVVRGNNLVMQPDSGGVMLSTITLNDDGTLVFSPLEDKTKLTFSKAG